MSTDAGFGNKNRLEELTVKSLTRLTLKSH